MCRPVRIVRTKFCSLHVPRPVSLSGVRLAVKLVPQGPDHAVLVAATETIHGPEAAGAGGSSKDSGWPDKLRVMSGAGPFGPTFKGVWQSWQPAVETRCSPRRTRSAWVVRAVMLSATLGVTRATCARAGSVRSSRVSLHEN